MLPPRRLPFFAGAVLLAALLACVACSRPVTQPPTVFYVVRHAEKVDQSDDALLTAQGRARAEALGGVLAGEHLNAVYATGFARTQQTALPTAEQQKLPVQTTTPGPEILLTRHRGERVLIVGHSNTVPALLAGLGVSEPVSADTYGDLFVVTIDERGTHLERRRFGDDAAP